MANKGLISSASNHRSRLRRWFSPSAFLVTLILFPLPWLEVQCNTSRAGRTTGKAASASPAASLSTLGEVQEWLLDHLGLPSSRWETAFSQSGLQAALGNYSPVLSSVNGKPTEDDSGLRAAMHGSLLMIIFPFVLLLGFVAGFAWWGSIWRRRFTTFLAVTALSLLVTQIVRGFPLQQAVLDLERADVVRAHQPASRVTPASLEPGMRFHYTCWFGLALCALSAVMVAECWNVRGKHHPQLPQLQAASAPPGEAGCRADRVTENGLD